MTSLPIFDQINKRVDNFFIDIASNDYAYNYLKSRHDDSDEDWSEVAHSSDFRYYFEERYFRRMPGRQPILSDQEWSIVSLVETMLDEFRLDHYCEDLADELGVKAWDVHQSMISQLWTFLIGTAWYVYSF